MMSAWSGKLNIFNVLFRQLKKAIQSFGRLTRSSRAARYFCVGVGAATFGAFSVAAAATVNVTVNWPQTSSLNDYRIVNSSGTTVASFTGPGGAFTGTQTYTLNDNEIYTLELEADCTGFFCTPNGWQGANPSIEVVVDGRLVARDSTFTSGANADILFETFGSRDAIVCAKQGAELNMLDASLNQNSFDKLTNESYFGFGSGATPDTIGFAAIRNITNQALVDHGCDIFIGAGIQALIPTGDDLDATEANALATWHTAASNRFVIAGCDRASASNICQITLNRSLTSIVNGGVSVATDLPFNPLFCAGASGAGTFGGESSTIGTSATDAVLLTHNLNGSPAVTTDDLNNPTFVITADADMLGSAGSNAIGAGPTATSDQALFLLNTFKFAIDEVFGRPHACAVDFNNPSALADFSDAPLTGTSYGGANHLIDGSTYLGPSVTDDVADFDDANANGDTDDGVIITDLIFGNTGTVSASVVGAGGFLQGWIDWNGDGDFADLGEQIATNVQDNSGSDNNAANGVIDIDVPVPATAQIGQTFSRFRWSTVSGLSANGTAGDGEVEDFAVAIEAPGAPFVCSSDLFVSASNPAFMIRLDLGTTPPTETQIVAPGGFGFNRVNATAYNTADNYIYALQRLGANTLLRVGNDGTVVQLGPVAGMNGDVIAGDFNAATGEYVVNTTTNSYTVDIVTGISTAVPHFGDVADIAYNPVDGLFYGIQTNGNVVSIDPNNNYAITTGVAPNPAGGGVTGATFFDNQGNFMVLNNGTQTLYGIDLSTGNSTILASGIGATDNNDGAACSAADPIVGSIAGRLYDDLNYNNNDDGEPGISDVTVNIYFENGTVGNTSDDVLIATRVTAADGSYEVELVNAGFQTYRIEVDTADPDIAPAYSIGTANPVEGVSVSPNQTTDVDFGFDAPYVLTCDATITSNMVLNGSASLGASNEIILTPDANDQSGLAWSNQPISLANPFTLEFSVNLGTNTANGADGIGFAFHNDPDGSAAVGNFGGALGVGGLSPAVAIEFDTFDNNNSPFNPDPTFNDTTPNDHAVIFDPLNYSDGGGGGPASLIGSVVDLGELEDGQWHLVSVSWDPATNILSYSVDGTPADSVVRDLINTDFAGDPLVYYGFTAGTGGFTNSHQVCIESAPSPPGEDRSDAPISGTSYGEALHTVIPGTQLGATIDEDAAQIANADATGDGPDDDGVTLPTLSQGVSYTVPVDVSGAGGFLQAWADWNGDGTFDPSDQIAADVQDGGTGDTDGSADGTITLNVPVPSNATTSQTFTRFRWSTQSGLDSTTAASDGEVEDYAITINENVGSGVSTCPQLITDEFAGTFGLVTAAQQTRDLQNPVPGYTYAPGGNSAEGQYVVTSDAWGSQSWNGFGQRVIGHTDGGAEDAYLLVNGATTVGTFLEETVPVAQNKDFEVSAWFFNWTNTAFDTPASRPTLALRIYDSTGTILLGEAVQTEVPGDGSWHQAFAVVNSGSNDSIVIRAENISTQAFGNDFVMDDLSVKSLLAPCFATDFSDAPISTTSYGGANHVIDTSLYLGAGVTAEEADFDSADADGDVDDGVTIPTLTQGQSETIQVAIAQTSGNDGYLQGWIDWNGNDVFDASEQIAADLQSPSAGTGLISVNVTVPVDAVTSQTFARFRWSTQAGLDFTSAAPDGEVEDYALTILTGGIPVSGSLFADTGLGGTAHDGIQDAGEEGLGGYVIQFVDAGGNIVATTETLGDGTWAVSLDAALDGTPLTIQPVLPAGVRNISGNAGGIVDADTTDGQVAFTPVAGASYTDIDFGVAFDPTLTESRSQSTVPGGTLTFAHIFTAKAAMSADFAIINESTSNAGAFSSALFHDVNCDGVINAGETVLDTTQSVAADETVCMVVRVVTAAAAPLGASLTYDVQALATFSNTGETSTLINSDSVTLSDGSSLELTKQVCNATTTTCDLSTGAGFANNNTGRPGELIVYRLSFNNPGAGPLSDVTVTDRTPTWSSLSATAPTVVTTPAGMTCSLTTPAAPVAGYAGSLQWTCTGELQSGDTGIVGFEVQVDQ